MTRVMWVTTSSVPLQVLIGLNSVIFQESWSSGQKSWGLVSAGKWSIQASSYWDSEWAMSTCMLPQVNKNYPVFQVIKGFKMGKVSGPNIILNRVLRHLPMHAVTILTWVFNAVFHRQYLAPTWKHFHMMSVLKLEKNPMLPLSYRLISLLDTVGSLFKKIIY
jgi:hypothetical protein